MAEWTSLLAAENLAAWTLPSDDRIEEGLHALKRVLLGEAEILFEGRLTSAFWATYEGGEENFR
jgi:hypothetical protein